MQTEREVMPTDRCKDKAHYWLLDYKSFGVCKKCGAKKQFPINVWGWQNSNLILKKSTHFPAKRGEVI